MRALRPQEKIGADELERLQREGRPLLLLDARDDRVYRESRIPGAVLPLAAQYYEDVRLAKLGFETSRPDLTAALDEAMRQTPRETPIVVYCARRCQASTAMVVVLKFLGFENVRALEDGVDAWQEKGYPMQLGVPDLREGAREDITGL